MTREIMGFKAMQEHKHNRTQVPLHIRRGKRMSVVFLVLAFISLAAAMPVSTEQKMVVVLDAGHGGSDPGNLGTGRYDATEKDVALDVTLKVGEYITQNYPDVTVIYTRKGDTFPSLAKRVETANTANADLFISIHCNAAENRSASGVETFVMGLHKSEESLSNAMKENNSIFLEKDHEKNYDGFDPKSPDTYIILSMRENLFLDKSITLAKSVQDQFRTRVGRKDRGVKQAGFYVISFTNMPSILVELGFLSNSEEEDFLNSDDGKTYLASAIYRAFKEFKDGGTTKPEEAGMTAKTEEKKPETEEKPVVTEIKQNTKVDTSNPAALIKSSTSQGIVWQEINKGVKYQVQIHTSPKKVEANAAELKNLERTTEYKQNGVYKYLAGCTATYKEAKENLEKLKAMGFKDAFVVAFENDQRIDLSKAIAQTPK
ncbi:MAG: N-acetylmuramoyl-L-alanine amidase [Flavobacteriales bacterium]